MVFSALWWLIGAVCFQCKDLRYFSSVFVPSSDTRRKIRSIHEHFGGHYDERVVKSVIEGPMAFPDKTNFVLFPFFYASAISIEKLQPKTLLSFQLSKKKKKHEY